MYNIGDLLITPDGFKFVIFDLTEGFIYITPFETQDQGLAIGYNEKFIIESKPENLEYLFIKRRERNGYNFVDGIDLGNK